jgi:uncharacterized membrane protein
VLLWLRLQHTLLIRLLLLLLLLHLLCVYAASCRTGIVEVPMNGDVMMLKRLFQYQAHNKLLPALQVAREDADILFLLSSSNDALCAGRDVHFDAAVCRAVLRS